MASGGPRAAADVFFRSFVGENVWEGVEASVRDRLLGNADVMFGVLLGAFAGYEPDTEALARVERPVSVLLGEETLPEFLAPIGERLAALAGTQLRLVSGGHAPFFDRPGKMAADLRAVLASLENR